MSTPELLVVAALQNFCTLWETERGSCQHTLVQGWMFEDFNFEIVGSHDEILARPISYTATILSGSYHQHSTANVAVPNK